MRLDELHGVKQYRTRTLGDFLEDFRDAGGETYSGENGTVLVHPKWNYVYKFFENDEYYLRYVRWAMRQNSPHVPQFLSKPRRVTPFYMRSARTPQIYIVKMERLSPIDDPLLTECLNRFFNGRSVIEQLTARKPEWDEAERIYDKNEVRIAELTSRSCTPEERKERLALLRARSEAIKFVRFVKCLKKYNSLERLVYFYYDVFSNAGLIGAHDMHAGNVMLRNDGTLVITDPLWKGGTSPLEQHRRMMQSEVMFDDPEYDRFDTEHGPHEPKGMLKGGQRWPKRKRPAKAPPRPMPLPSNPDDDIPF